MVVPVAVVSASVVGSVPVCIEVLKLAAESKLIVL